MIPDVNPPTFRTMEQFVSVAEESRSLLNAPPLPLLFPESTLFVMFTSDDL